MTTTSAPLVENYFSGRKAQLREFESFAQGKCEYQILFIDGPGGIGKTWLLRKMITTAHEMQVPELLVVDNLIDMYSTANHTVEGVREQLILLLEEALGRPAFENFRQSQRELETGIQKGFREETLNSMRQSLQKDFLEGCRILSKDIKPMLFFDTFERVQRDRVGKWVMIELARNLPDFLFVVASREAWSGNTHVHSLPLRGFSPEETQKYFEKRGWDEAEREMLDVIREKASGHPLRIELAIEFLSGNLLQDVSKMRELKEDEFEKALIAPLREIGQGLFGSPKFDEAVHQTILFMAYFNRRFNTDLLRRFLEQGAVDIRGLQPKDVLRELEQEFFFVKARPGGDIQLHDEMERLINQHLWPMMDPSGEFRRELAHIACQWYDEQIKEAEGEEKILDDLKAEQLIYWIDVDLDKAGDLLRTYGYGSFVLNNLLVVEIKPEKVDALSTKYRYRFAVDLGDRARRVYLYERGQDYWRIAVRAARQSDNPDQIIDALLGLHNCTHPLDLSESLDILKNEALPLCERCETRRSQVLYEIGFTYRRLQEIPRAIRWYEKAKEVAHSIKLMATILNDLGYAYVLFGEYKQAGRYVKRARELRQEQVRRLESELSDLKKRLGVSHQQVENLERDLSDARWLLGLSFNTLGQVKRFDGDLAAATGAYSEALEIFSQGDVSDYMWLSNALHSRGEAHRRIAAVLFDQDRFGACDEYEKRAREDIDESLELCDQFGFQKHTVNRRMGRLLHDQAKRASDLEGSLKLLEKARSYFEKGLQAAKDNENTLDELENLTELAFLVDDRLEAQKQLSDSRSLSQKQIENGRRDIEALREGLERHRNDPFVIYQFPVFEHLLELEEGAFRFVQSQFDEALEFYLNGYAGLASTPGYGVARYRQHLGHLFDQLKKLEDPALVRQWGDAFINKWNETKIEPVGQKDIPQPLSQLHPALVEEMRIYLDTAFLAQGWQE
jgi:tetratricopeptide (TPR) repeat protein